MKILQIGNYPPPLCGWSIQTKLLVEEIRRRGITCDVLNLSENHRRKSPDYIDVQNGLDYLCKVIRFALSGYHFQVHVNGQDTTGYLLALAAAIIGRLTRCPVALSWRGGYQQKYFPRAEASVARWAFQLLFRLAGQISCNSTPVKSAIERYGIDSARVSAIPGFSAQHLDFRPVVLSAEIETFLKQREMAFFCYVSFRPEYQLPVLREGMQQFRKLYPRAGFVWLGFPCKEMAAAVRFVNDWPEGERQSFLLLGNLTHDEFLTLLSRSFAVIRTPMCDGVSASVLEALALGIPVIASDNEHRPDAVVTFRDGDAEDLCRKLIHVVSHYKQIKQQTRFEGAEDNIARTADWLLADSASTERFARSNLAHAD